MFLQWEIMILVFSVCILNSLPGVSISSKPTAKGHWHSIKSFCIY